MGPELEFSPDVLKHMGEKDVDGRGAKLVPKAEAPRRDRCVYHRHTGSFYVPFYGTYLRMDLYCRQS